MKSKAGYSLPEMLVAIALVALTLAGVAQAAQTISLTQGRAIALVTTNTSLRSAQVELQNFVDRASEQGALSGDGSSLRGCGGACMVQITSGRMKFPSGDRGIALPSNRAHFTYLTARRAVSETSQLVAGEAVLAVAVIDEGDQPLLVARTSLSEVFGCEFELITLECRQASRP